MRAPRNEPMKKILIMDDEPQILFMLSRALRKYDAEILTAVKIEDAEYAIKSTPIDVVISDIRLTGVLGREGLELLPYIRETSPNTSVIIMTGYGSPDIEKEAYEKGANSYYEKPIDLEQLLARIESFGIVRRDDGGRI